MISYRNWNQSIAGKDYIFYDNFSIEVVNPANNVSITKWYPVNFSTEIEIKA